MAMYNNNNRREKAEVKIRTCYFCENPKELVDYKNDKQMIRYTNEDGKIIERGRNGLCALHQRKMAREIKRARHIAFVPFVRENIR